MRICILSDSYQSSDSPLKAVDTPCDPSPYLIGHDHETVHLKKATAIQQVVDLVRRGQFDLFFNLCDGAWDEDRPGIEVVQALERLEVPFTGANSAFYEPSREVMKRVCHAWGVRTPAGIRARSQEDVTRAARELRFPLIAKHPSSYSSIGLTPASRVENLAALREQAGRMIDSFGATLIEEFVDGREFSVLVAENPNDPEEPVAYLPVEILFPAGETFKHFDLKWVDYEGMDCVPCEDDVLAERLKDACRKLFVGLRGSGYGRCDVRIDASGEPYLLEINPNCGVFYPPGDPGTADLILLHDPVGSHESFCERIVESALRSRERGSRRWEVRADREGDSGMFATRPLDRGEVVEPYEERPHHLVSRSHVEATWGPDRTAWFHRYAYPLTDEIFFMWSPDPEEWKPINHSCDPSAWLRGLDVVARRPIDSGEEITLDYATFCTEEMRDFECHCGAPECRRTIRGTDYLEPFVDRYGDHVSDYVRTKRRELRSSSRTVSPRRRGASMAKQAE